MGSAAFLNYKGLKKIINSIDIPPSASSTANANSNAAAVTAVTATGGHDVLLQPYKTAFFFKLERELEKVFTLASLLWLLVLYNDIPGMQGEEGRAG